MILRPLTVLVSGSLATTACAPPPAPRSVPVAPAKLLTWHDLLARPKPAPDKTFRYGADPYQVADLWLPKGKGRHPVVLMVHGGCWTTSIADRTLMNWAAADLRERGIAVWNIDYRGVDRPRDRPDDGGIPTLGDVSRAADLLQSRASAERLDLRRVVAVGHSAGGHLALWLAARLAPNAIVTGRPLAIAHVVSLGGLPDLEQAWDQPQGCGNAPIAALVAQPGKTENATSQRARLRAISIPTLAPLRVSQTLINGDADRIIPTNFAHDYALRMRAAGDQVDVRIVPRQGHVELIAPGTPAWAEAVRAIEAALRR